MAYTERKKRVFSIINLNAILKRKPDAVSFIMGNSENKNLHGEARFYQTEQGVIVATEIFGLPENDDLCASPIFALHIHEGVSCSGDDFSETGMHYNPKNCPHPYHSGDMPPLFSSNGYAISLFLTNRFNVAEIIGKTVVIHSLPDDFTTQPSGNAGAKIACGVIYAF